MSARTNIRNAIGNAITGAAVVPTANLLRGRDRTIASTSFPACAVYAVTEDVEIRTLAPNYREQYRTLEVSVDYFTAVTGTTILDDLLDTAVVHGDRRHGGSGAVGRQAAQDVGEGLRGRVEVVEATSHRGAEEVLDLWRLLEPAWGPAREVRASQPVMVADHDPAMVADERVRWGSSADLDVLVPACVAMFTAEVGVSPVEGGMASAYRARIAEIVRSQRSLVLIEDGVVQFKAEVGAVAGGVCQVQGVWVDPAWRGRRLSEGGMAAVVEMARASIAPVVSLYVNDYNVAARKAYRAVGFREQGAFATVLF